ncbi:MAG: glycosyltransferase [Thermoleophilaceae bacterium]|nr:glycosyltransferase [Thermoleophilaceae bacterium]
MRVAMVSEHASPLAALGGVDAGGQNVHVAALAGAIARRGIQVVVYTRRDDERRPERVRMSPGVEVCHVRAGPPRPISKDELLPYMDDFAERLHGAWRRERPDVVHAHFWMSGSTSLRAARELGIPMVQTFHALGVVKRRYQGDKDTSPAGRVEIEKDIVRRADRIVATCTDEVFELIRMGASNADLTVIPCGVDLELFRPDGPSEPRTPGRARLACVGRLVERKGIGNVISALALLPDVELVVAGGPNRAELDADPEARRLGALAEEVGVADRVELRGRLEREELPPLLRSCDALVTAPWYEPFGIVSLEAMACGVPVVASAVGGLIDTVVDGLTGVHVPPRDPERLAAALSPLLADAERRAAYGRAGLERARRLYDWNRIATATLDVYARLVRRRPRRARDRSVGRFTLPPTPAEHVRALIDALPRMERELERLSALGERLAARLLEGGRLLAVGNGGSAAQAQHLTAELVGRYQSERRPLSAICLHGDSSSLTAIANDYGPEQAFARQVMAHGRPGDVLVALSTSGRSANVLAAARAAREAGLETWAFTGPAPNPLAELCDEVAAFACPSTATVQELHMVALHVLCAAVDREVSLCQEAPPRQETLL